MEAFYVCIIFLGIILVIASMFFIIMDKVNGKDFFKEFDRKKDEMFNLIQDSEEMIHELNKMSDYVVSVITEKNQEFFAKNANKNARESSLESEKASKELPAQVQQEQISLVAQEKIESDKLPEAEVLQSSKPEIQSEDIELHNQNATNQSQDNNERENEKLKNTEISVKAEDELHEYQDLVAHKKPKIALSGRRGQVLQMIEKGLTDEEISQQLKIGKGEIRLIRGLSK